MYKWSVPGQWEFQATAAPWGPSESSYCSPWSQGIRCEKMASTQFAGRWAVSGASGDLTAYVLFCADSIKPRRYRLTHLLLTRGQAKQLTAGKLNPAVFVSHTHGPEDAQHDPTDPDGTAITGRATSVLWQLQERLLCASSHLVELFKNID